MRRTYHDSICRGLVMGIMFGLMVIVGVGLGVLLLHSALHAINAAMLHFSIPN